ncbi:MAG: phage holin family protein [Nesterenkonia sp.]
MAQQQSKNKAPSTSLADVIKVLLRLGPKQVNDEITLAIAQMKTKGIAAGIAAALMVVGLVFLTFLVVALIVAAIAALHLIFELWAAALIVAGAFLLIALIVVLIGLLKLKGAMPLVPEDAIRGFRLDLGVVREGTSFDPRSLDRADAQKREAKEEAKRQAEEQKKRDAKTPGAGEPQKPSYTELLRRTAQRRDHIAGLQNHLVGRRSKTTSADSGQAAPDAAASSEDANRVGAKERLAARWKPVSIAAGSAAAAGVFLRELTKK